MVAAQLGSILLGTRNVPRLRRSYVESLGAELDPDGFLHLGGVAVLIDRRRDVDDVVAEPGRVILTYQVSDIAARVAELDERNAEWVSPLEYREDGAAWFATLRDPDGNYVQLVELTPAYWIQRRERHNGHPLGRASLMDATLAVRLPAQDLDRAQEFYSQRLGLEPVESRPGALRYQVGPDSFALFTSTGRPSGEHTQLGFCVEDLPVVVEELRRRGLEFDDVELPGATSHDGIVDIDGSYPSTGASGERAIWFHDSEGNLIGIGQLAR
jgi:catechol 2,3-dioxygenase-like lactoylglutathione lyase family enzyme